MALYTLLLSFLCLFLNQFSRGWSYICQLTICPSVLRHFWLGNVACTNCPRNDIGYYVSLTHSLTACLLTYLHHSCTSSGHSFLGLLAYFDLPLLQILSLVVSYYFFLHVYPNKFNFLKHLHQEAKNKLAFGVQNWVDSIILSCAQSRRRIFTAETARQTSLGRLGVQPCWHYFT